MKITRRFHLAVLAALSAALLVSCGGAFTSKDDFDRVIVAGDSLADAGTFGLKFTVQNSAAPADGFPIWPEIVAAEYEVDNQCNYYTFNGTTYVTDANCNNYAVGGARIVNPAAQGGTNSPQSIPTQLAAASAQDGPYSKSDLVLVDGGGNDAADLVGAFLGVTDAASQAAYRDFLLQQIPAATLDPILAQPDGNAQAAGLYMRNLADTYYNAIKVNVIDRGASHVAVLNLPDITLTPRFRQVLAQVAQARGDVAAAQLQAAIRQWIGAFNTRLAERIGTDSRVALVDFNGDFTDEVQNPTKYGLTNATQSACEVAGIATIQACTTAALDANPPAGQRAGWWQTWAFSDSFHPTPLGHRLLADSVFRALAAAGWL
ncbi:MAG: phospholipase/lecithinase/hemolysin-like protein [Ramlibacter sp.]|jgi:phospholipase/lecithinase/hemolysin|nr:phospholipase/lecithinase/hemolysin-like protein [Ramlibacter sp.]MCE3272012.1 phospholipase/lecithinase/hemolysin-like protein [Ramlibacter sp.]